MNLKRVAFCLISSLACLSCGQIADINQASAAQTTAYTSKKFAFDLFNRISSDKSAKKANVLLSPFSAYAALSMTLNGAKASTLAQIAKTLGTSSANLDQLNKRNHDAIIKLTANKDVKLELADAIFVDSSIKLKTKFVDLCKQSYKAEAYMENFGSSDSVNKINHWCDEKTHGKIPQILRQLSADDKIVLLNAIYFKGAWMSTFEKEATKENKFTAEGGKVELVKMMNQQTLLPYYRSKHFASVEMPYAGRKQSLFIFLPDKDSSVATFQAQFNPDNWNIWMKGYKDTAVLLSMPRFTINLETQLKNILSSMGMEDAFSRSKADFSNMLEQNAWISSVLQKTFMQLNEDGTEAAAVTAIKMTPKCAEEEPVKPLEFKVDRPFVIALVDKETDEILFLGKIADLDKNSK